MFILGGGAFMTHALAKIDTTQRPEMRRFSERIIDLMPSVTHQLALTDEDRDRVFRVRYEAYHRQHIIDERKDQLLFDAEYDSAPNSFLTMTSIRGEFVTTFRVSVADAGQDKLPSRAVFSDLIDPYLRSGATVVDPTRLAACLSASRTYPELPFLALRPAWLASMHFDADVVLATVAVEHIPFYQRVFGYQALCEPRDYPMVHFKIVCLALDFPAVRESVEARYPFLRSTNAEREALFGQGRNPRAAATAVAPTARSSDDGASSIWIRSGVYEERRKAGNAL
jgi:hypothetical protein